MAQIVAVAVAVGDPVAANAEVTLIVEDVPLGALRGKCFRGVEPQLAARQAVTVVSDEQPGAKILVAVAGDDGAAVRRVAV